MAYIGNAPNTAIVNQTTSQSFNGTGSATAFTLNRSVNVSEDLEVFVNNVQQEPGSGKSYTASGTTLTFDEAPPSGTGNVYVIYRGEATINPRLEHDANSALAATTGTFTGDITLPDSAKAIFGAGSDLQIYHDGSHSYIKDNGTGSLLIQGSTAVVIEDPSGNNMAFFEDGGEAILYHNAGARLTTKATGVEVAGSAIMTGTDTFNSNASGAGILLKDSGVTSRQLHIVAPGSVSEATIGTPNSHHLLFATNNTERFKIDSSGQSYFFQAPQQSGQANFYSVSEWAISVRRPSAGSAGMIRFENGTSYVGGITTSTTATQYNTTSDYRLKTAVTYDWDATTRLKQLRPARFEWIADGEDAVLVDGFLAHEVQDIVPESITGTHNEVDEDGNPVYQAIDQSKVVPLLVKTIQELEARIAALEGN